MDTGTLWTLLQLAMISQIRDIIFGVGSFSDTDAILDMLGYSCVVISVY